MGDIELSPSHARKIILLSQGIHKQAQFGKGRPALLRAIEQLSYVQIDTISVVERAHHHTLWNRVRGYHPQHLALLQQQKQIFEYWSHAAAYLPMRDYRFSLPRKSAYANGEMHWYEPDAKLNRIILRQIQEQGPLQAKDFVHKGSGNAAGWWDWKPAKKALEQLFMQGELMITERKGFQKVYDLTERVLPPDVDTTTPSRTEYMHYLITRFLTANGIGTAAEIAYLRKGIKASLTSQCNAMFADGQLVKVLVNGQHYFALPEIETMLSHTLSRSKVVILSPFDNLLIQRKRTKALFDFDYQIECYVPAAKRRYGYFCLPLLWGQNFAGRMDAKINRKTAVLDIVHLHLQTPKTEEFIAALKPAILNFLRFNRGRKVVPHEITSDLTQLKPAVVHELKGKLAFQDEAHV